MNLLLCLVHGSAQSLFQRVAVAWSVSRRGPTVLDAFVVFSGGCSVCGLSVVCPWSWQPQRLDRPHVCVSLNVVCVNAWMHLCGHVFFCLGMHRVVCIRCWPKVMAADGRDPTPTWWACWEQSVPRLGGLSVVVRERWTSHRSLFSLAHVSMHAITHSSSGKAQPSAVSCVHGTFSFLTRCGSSVHS